MNSHATQGAPPRGTRPGNRRALTLAAAAELFYRDGYATVAMGDIASEVNVGASAIYRHFSSKSDLLVAAIHFELEPYARVLSADAGDATLDELLERLAECALDHRQLGVLWQREARNLSVDDQRTLRDELRTTTGFLATRIENLRPGISRDSADLLAWCIMGLLGSIGFSSLTLPRPRYVELLASLATSISTLELTRSAPETIDPDDSEAPATSRREDLVAGATRLFAERGFGAVAVDEIADAVGIAGPSIYSHFASKQAVLVEAMQRGNDLLRVDAEAILDSDSSAQDKLGSLVQSYVRLAIGNRFLLRIILSEQNQLEGADRALTRQQQREYIDTWAKLLREFTDDDLTSARIRVQAVLIVVNDAVQTPHLRAQPGFEHTLRQLAGALLQLPA